MRTTLVRPLNVGIIINIESDQLGAHLTTCSRHRHERRGTGDMNLISNEVLGSISKLEICIISHRVRFLGDVTVMQLFRHPQIRLTIDDPTHSSNIEIDLRKALSASKFNEAKGDSGDYRYGLRAFIGGKIVFELASDLTLTVGKRNGQYGYIDKYMKHFFQESETRLIF